MKDFIAAFLFFSLIAVLTLFAQSAVTSLAPNSSARRALPLLRTVDP